MKPRMSTSSTTFKVSAGLDRYVGVLMRLLSFILMLTQTIRLMDNACTTSTHRALICQEIVENVCEFLDPYQLNKQLRQGAESTKPRSTLVKLAHTCKAFSDPALRVLWRHLGGISHLLRVLPQYMPARSDDAFVSQCLLH